MYRNVINNFDNIIHNFLDYILLVCIHKKKKISTKTIMEKTLPINFKNAYFHLKKKKKLKFFMNYMLVKMYTNWNFSDWQLQIKALIHLIALSIPLIDILFVSFWVFNYCFEDAITEYTKLLFLYLHRVFMIINFVYMISFDLTKMDFHG